jgi:hypothetical protein
MISRHGLNAVLQREKIIERKERTPASVLLTNKVATLVSQARELWKPPNTARLGEQY